MHAYRDLKWAAGKQKNLKVDKSIRFRKIQTLNRSLYTGCSCLHQENLGLRGQLWQIKSYLIIWHTGLWRADHLHCQSPQIHSSLRPFHPFPSLPFSHSSAHGWNVSVIAFSWFACKRIKASSTAHLETAFFLYVAAHRNEQWREEKRRCLNTTHTAQHAYSNTKHRTVHRVFNIMKNIL